MYRWSFHPVTSTASVLQLGQYLSDKLLINSNFFLCLFSFSLRDENRDFNERNDIISATSPIARQFPVSRDWDTQINTPFPKFRSTSDRCREYNRVMLAWYRVRRKSCRWARQQQQQLARQTRSTGVSRDTQTCWRHNEAKRLAANTRRHAPGQWPEWRHRVTSSCTETICLFKAKFHWDQFLVTSS